jgi:hypothetical protein
MRQAAGILVMCAVVVVASACVTLSRSEQTTLQELGAYGIRGTEIQKKSPVAAGALNILPGFGNFYLAIGSSETNQWLFGAANLLVWPLSIFWGVPEAAIDAGTINKKETIYYYTYDPSGKQDLARRRAAAPR